MFKQLGMVRHPTLVGLLGAAALGTAWDASAQQFQLNRYDAPITPADGLHLSRPVALRAEQLTALLVFDYAKDPLVLELEQGFRETQAARLVKNQLQGQARFAFGVLDSLTLSAGVDTTLYMSGEQYDDPASGTTFAPADGAGLGDWHLGARYVVFAADQAPVQLAIQVQSTVPLARWANSEQNLSGERGATVAPQLLGEWSIPGVRVSGNLGYLVRKNAQIFNTAITDELTFGLGSTIALSGPLKGFEALAEVYGSTASSDLFGGRSTPVEALLGGRFHPSEQWQVTLAGGTGLLRGVGSPSYRAVVSLGFTLLAEVDADGDRINDDLDACPHQAEDMDGFEDTDGCPDPDNDRDGIVDTNDRCRDTAEDVDGFEEQDGCPDLDNDRDGIADEVDSCTDEAEDVDGFEDADGCPDPDNDGDGIPDDQDQCTNDPEDVDGFEDADGCPDPDNDGDGIPDDQDQCPLTSGSTSDKGCAAAKVEHGQIRLAQRIEFAKGQDTLLAESQPALEAIVAVLNEHSEVREVAIEGHSDSSGSVEVNQSLSERRAQAVVSWLLTRGVAVGRLQAWGCGPHRPLTENETPEGRRTNRRVELHVLDPAPDAARDATACRKLP